MSPHQTSPSPPPSLWHTPTAPLTLLPICLYTPLPPTPLTPQTETRIEYEKVIQETEAAYLKILESSQTLLTVLKREAVNIQKKRQASS